MIAALFFVDFLIEDRATTRSGSSARRYPEHGGLVAGRRWIIK
jgi:hypothetical protein